MAPFGDSAGKRIVRESWNTPLLEYLNKTYGFRYRYFGLPGPDIIDIKLWRHLLDEVIAFEVNTPGPDALADITLLRTNLRKLGIANTTYYGSFESVVIHGQDWDGRPYSRDRLITLYNLDFCDELGSKIAVARPGSGDKERRLRFHAIRQILMDQAECFRKDSSTSWFLILLTVRDQMDAGQLRGLLAQLSMHDSLAYQEVCAKLSPVPTAGPVKGTHTWALKAFMHDSMRNYLAAPNIRALFFPLVRYTGRTAASPMLHWMIFCCFEDAERANPRYYPKSFLEVPGIRADAAEGLLVSALPGESAGPGVPSSVTWFRQRGGVFGLDKATA